MYYTREIEKPDDDPQVVALFAAFGLCRPEQVETTLGLYEGRMLLACCSRRGNVLQGLAVCADRQGENLTAQLLCRVIEQAATQGLTHLLMFSRPDMENIFTSIGFAVVARAEPHATLFEYGIPGIAEYQAVLREKARSFSGDSACIVMNANPFTRGHLHLATLASQEHSHVWILVVQEDRSQFPFANRIQLVRTGVAHLPNVAVLPGGEYTISSSAFPSYFTKKTLLAEAQAALDAAIFASRIAPALGVTTRYVGTEPTCEVSRIYNTMLAERLPPYGISLREIPRLEHDGVAVSASAVRDSLMRNLPDKTASLVPPGTLEFLRSEEAKAVIARIRDGNS